MSIRQVRREWHYGDRVRFWIRPQAPRDAGNPGGFDYATYLARQEIYAIGYLENDQEVELVARRPGRVRGAIESLRREIRRYIDQHVSSDNGALMKALVVGDMGAVTKEMRNEFTAAGVNHVLSISGLHVSMLGLVVFWLVRFGCSYSTYLTLRCNLVKVGTFFSFMAVVFYTAIAGAMVPTVRSAIMIGVYELAVLLDREEEVFASLTFAALIIALIWPAVIADISFQLSFLAVLFIVWGMRRMMDGSPRRPRDELPQERSWWKHKLQQGTTTFGRAALCNIGHRAADRSLFRSFVIGRFYFQPCDCAASRFYRCAVGTGYRLSLFDTPVRGGGSGVARRIFIVGNALAGPVVCAPSPRQCRGARAKCL